jgi:hypothetical protein
LYVDNENDILEGYKEDDKFELNGKGVSGLRYEYGCKYVFENDIDKVSDTKKYDINCLIILYDIKSWDESGESNDLYTDIPLGLYLPGCFDQNIMTNPIIKWVSNSIIYNSGTSYGIRICTRFSLVPNSDNLLTTDIELVNSDEYASMCKIMAGISDNLELMKSITTQSVFTSDNLKDTLNMFQNSKTNVPYILEVNGVKYWFVNGKNTGVAIDGSDGFNKYEGCDDKEVYDLLEELSLNSIVTETKLYPYDINTGNIKYYQKKYFDEIQDSVDVLMRWEFKNKYTQEIIIPQQVSYTYEGETYTARVQYNGSF